MKKSLSILVLILLSAVINCIKGQTPCASSPCFSLVDKCWDVDGPDSLWTNPANWCPFGVPSTGEWVELPDGAVVYYDYSGPDVINRIDVKRAEFTINPNETLVIENDPNCNFCSMLVNGGKVENLGSIILRKGQHSGLINQGLFDNYGSILIDSSGLRGSTFAGGMIVDSIFNNHPNGSVDIITGALGGGFENRNKGQFLNMANATLKVNNTLAPIMILNNGSFLVNNPLGVIDIYDLTNQVDKVIIDSGAVVTWDFSVEVR